MGQTKKQIYWCHLYTCNDPQFKKLSSDMTNKDKIIAATRVGIADRTDTFMIVIRDSKHISRYGYNYATELLTGIQIPILAELGRNLLGNIDKPYCGKVCLNDFWGDNQNNGRGLFPKILGSTPKVEWIKEYINDHMDPDGSYTTYKKQLEEMINNSIINYKSIKIEEPEKPVVPEKVETIQDVYVNFVRSRKGSNANCNLNSH